MARKPVTSPEDLGQNDANELPATPEVEVVAPEDDLIPMLSVAQSGVRPGTIVHIREIFVQEMLNKGEVTFLPEEE